MNHRHRHSGRIVAGRLMAGLLLCCCSCLTIKQDIGLSDKASQAARGFTPETETRMIYTYVGRIYESVEDYPQAIAYFERKLEAYPKKPKASQRVLVNSEKSVILNQMGGYAYGMGDYKAALEYYRKSLALAAELEVVHGEVVNSANMGRVALRMLAGAGAERARSLGAATMLPEAARAQRRALERIDAADNYPYPEYRLYLRANLAALAQQAAALGMVLPLKSQEPEGNKG